MQATNNWARRPDQSYEEYVSARKLAHVLFNRKLKNKKYAHVSTSVPHVKGTGKTYRKNEVSQ